MPRPKIGAVSYLNTKPLVAGLETDASDYQLIFDLPSRLADQLSQGELDVALIPVIEAAANPDYTIVSDACIACQGPVWSVKLFSKVPIAEIKTLALDEGSRTSRALTRIFLANKFGIEPDCQLLPIDQDWTQTDCDAALVIGDRAMKTEAANFPISLDLGTAWHDWTGMPFVFAVWAARPGTNLEYVSTLLSKARDSGLKCLAEIAADQASRYNLSQADCLRYLDQFIHYHLGDQEKQGMDLYFQHAAKLALIAQPAQLRFHEPLLS